MEEESEERVFKALADGSRRLLLDRLFERGGQTQTELTVGLGMTRQAVTKHLGILEAANLVWSRKEGRERRYLLNPVPIDGIARRWIAKFEHGQLNALEALKKGLEEER